MEERDTKREMEKIEKEERSEWERIERELRRVKETKQRRECFLKLRELLIKNRQLK